MAQKVQVSVICDLPHTGEAEGQETVVFSFDGTAYEIDACTEHVKELREWAKSRGLKVNERGRIPASIVAEYESAR